MRGVFFCLILALVGTSLNSQTLVVKDKLTHELLENVAVYSESPRASKVTNSRGEADISRFEGADNIRLELIGYKTALLSYRQLKESQFTVFLAQSPFTADEIVVSATRWEQPRSEVPSRIIGIRPADVTLQNPQTAADMLNTSGEVFIQKSQLGGGSPMIRGFATNRVLIAVDGVRMNTAIFRSGNLQNVISLDPFATNKTEVVFGPGSVIYGSDAIGGVMSFYTLAPQFSATDKIYLKGNAATRSSSANFEKTGHFDLLLGFRKWGFATSVTYSDYGDLVMGSHGPDEYLRSHYVKTINGQDSTFVNPDPQKQAPSGYNQFNLMQKIRFAPNPDWNINYGFYYSTTSDYPRYDRLVRYRGDNLRSAEWYYGPQVWMMNTANILNTDHHQWSDNLNLTLTHQFFEESRHDRDFRQTTKYHRTEKVNVFSANLDFDKAWSERHRLFYGAELLLNKVSSTGEDENISTGKIVPGPSRYPDGATWNSYAGYLNYRFRASQKLTLQSGVRYNRVTLNAKFDTTFYPFPFTTADMNTGALNGSAGMVFVPEQSWQFSLNLSTGFRAPNVDDVGKVFDSEPGSVVVPNPRLNPEYAYNAEMSVTKIFGDLFKVDLTGYYTLLRDALVRRDFTLDGKDSIFYDGELSRVQAIQNAAEATVKGIQAGIELKFPSGISFLSRVNYQNGEEELDDGSTAPLRHAAPWFGNSHLIFTRHRFQADLYGIYNGEVANKNLAPEEQGKDYIYAIDSNGNPYCPGWFTLNLKLLVELTNSLRFSGGVENITDQRYRPYSSGIVAPGRNFIASLHFDF